MMKKVKEYFRKHLINKLLLFEVIEYIMQTSFLFRYADVIPSLNWSYAILIIHISTGVSTILISQGHKSKAYLDIAMGVDSMTDLYFAFTCLDNTRFFDLKSTKMVN